MAVAKRQGREKPTKIEQRKVKGRSKDGPRTGVRTSGRTALLPKPNLHRAGPGGRKKHIKGGAKALSHRLSLSRVLGRSSPRVFGSTCPHTLKMDFPAIF